MLIHQRLLSSTALMAPDGALASAAAAAPAANAGAAAAAAAAPGAGPSAPAGGGQAQEKPAAAPGAVTPPAPYRPEGLPDHLFGKNNEETVDKLFKAVDGFRRGENERGVLPKAPEDYKLEFDDKLKPYTANFDKDPVYKGTLKRAHEAGITDKQLAKFLPGVMADWIEGGMVAAPIDAKAELLKLTPASAANLDDAGKLAAASARLKDNIAWVDGFKAQKILPEPVADWLAAQATDSLQANLFIDWLRGTATEQRPALDGGKPAGGADAAAVTARLNDPRNNPSSPKFEKGFAEETDRQSKLVWPG